MRRGWTPQLAALIIAVLLSDTSLVLYFADLLDSSMRLKDYLTSLTKPGGESETFHFIIGEFMDSMGYFGKTGNQKWFIPLSSLKYMKRSLIA
jgi:hypothetical protein